MNFLCEVSVRRFSYGRFQYGSSTNAATDAANVDGRRFQLGRRGRGRWRLFDRAAAEGIVREESSHFVRGREDRLGSSSRRRRRTSTTTCQEAGVHALRQHRRKGGRRRWGGRAGGGRRRRRDAHLRRSARRAFALC